MRVYREILKYLKDYVIDRVVLTEFDENTLTEEWKGYNPTLNLVDVTAYESSVEFSNIILNKPLILQMLYIERLDDRNTLEIDIKSSTEIPKDGLEILLCEGLSINNPKLVLKNEEIIPADTLTTVSFNIKTSIMDRIESLAKIRTVGFNFKVNIDSLIISKVDALHPEFTFTIEDVMEYYSKGYSYVLSGLGKPTLPNNDNLIEAVYMASASYLWLKQEGKVSGKGNIATNLFKQVDKAIIEYLNGGIVDRTAFKNIKPLGGFKWSRIQ